MSQSPRCAPIEATVPRESDDGADDDLIAAFAVVWVASVARVTIGLASGETFGTEATLAMLTALFLPWLIAKSRSLGREGGGPDRPLPEVRESGKRPSGRYGRSSSTLMR